MSLPINITIKFKLTGGPEYSYEINADNDGELCRIVDIPLEENFPPNGEIWGFDNPILTIKYSSQTLEIENVDFESHKTGWDCCAAKIGTASFNLQDNSSKILLNVTSDLIDEILRLKNLLTAVSVDLVFVAGETSDDGELVVVGFKFSFKQP